MQDLFISHVLNLLNSDMTTWIMYFDWFDPPLVWLSKSEKYIITLFINAEVTYDELVFRKYLACRTIAIDRFNF